MTIYDLTYYAIDDCMEIMIWDFSNGGNYIFDGTIDDMKKSEVDYESMEVSSWEINNEKFVVNVDTRE